MTELTEKNRWAIIGMYVLGILGMCNAWYHFIYRYPAAQVNLSLLMAGVILMVAVMEHKKRRQLQAAVAGAVRNDRRNTQVAHDK